MERMAGTRAIRGVHVASGAWADNAGSRGAYAIGVSGGAADQVMLEVDRVRIRGVRVVLTGILVTGRLVESAGRRQVMRIFEAGRRANDRAFDDRTAYPARMARDAEIGRTCIGELE